jgi:hypothetical protein
VIFASSAIAFASLSLSPARLAFRASERIAERRPGSSARILSTVSIARFGSPISSS